MNDENSVDLTALTIKDLKAYAYDLSVTLSATQDTIIKVNTEIKNRPSSTQTQATVEPNIDELS